MSLVSLMTCVENREIDEINRNVENQDWYTGEELLKERMKDLQHGSAIRKRIYQGFIEV
jgi:hypothetical protein